MQTVVLFTRANQDANSDNDLSSKARVSILLYVKKERNADERFTFDFKS